MLNIIDVPSAKSPYAVQRISVSGIPVIRLLDSVRDVEVSILPSFGNSAYEMKVHGKNVLFFPYADLAEFQKKLGRFGIPFMGPWANRLDDTGFWANGKRYAFNLELGNIRKDNRGLPIHGLLSNSSPWQVTEASADSRSAHVTSKFEFRKDPDLMAQWPFAHEYEMTYRLADGTLEVKTTVSNLSAEAMPIAIGFHPYYQIPDVPRDQWILRMPACKAVVVDDRLIPSGEFKAFALPNPIPLAGHTLDDGFTDLERDAKGRARFVIEAAGKQIELHMGPKYPAAVVWAPPSPPGQTYNFICVEPMAGITNAINLNHAGKYPALQILPAGGKWKESFWISARGF